MVVSKCIEHINNPCELGLYIDSPTPTTISIKSLIACQYINGMIPPTLTLTFTIAPHVVVTIIDDLCSDSPTSSPTIWHNKISFYQHNNSSLTYQLNPTQRADNNVSCIVEKELNFTLLGKHANATAMCLCTSSGSNSYFFKTVQEHKAPHTTSTLTIKGVLTDNAKLKSNSLIKVYKRCSAVNATHINKNLLLSPQVRALSIPRLEIETDDVQCRHDATMRKLSAEQIFYLQSRGMSAEQTKKELIRAFLG